MVLDRVLGRGSWFRWDGEGYGPPAVGVHVAMTAPRGGR